ncbi:hypothetical protein 2016DhaA_0405 [Vibrio phage ICP1]|jgi:hypothetical protein|nr:hypothetical protein [Vibrio phage JSF14]AXY82177.1 hypothetical protein ICP12011A_082 [Vibrio phage ICP1_2011_A]AXY82396.1 hypothetical protein ICP12011B_079 [Vibrio phage ICP1_2011_B]QVV99518.1 hypothetical protein 2016DhaA_0405 [Vibrio phage ICP1]HAS3707681.1 hypothetical protein [Vibrio cholerae]
MWNIQSIPFDPVQRCRTIAEAIGEVVPDLLGSLTVSSNSYKIDLTDITTPATYTLDTEVMDLDTGVTTLVNLTFTSAGTETVDELYTVLVDTFSTATPLLHFSTNLDFTLDAGKYFTLAAKEGVGFVQGITVSPNITITEELVAAPIGKPAAYMQYGKQPICQYPLIVVTPILHEEHNSVYGKGSIEVDGVQRPYVEAYIKMRVSVRCESGDYQQVLTNGTPSAGYILNQFKRRIQYDNHRQTFFEKVNASIQKDITITPVPVIDGLNHMDASTAIIEFDLIDRYIEMQGGALYAVEVKQGKFFIDKTQVMDNKERTIARPDYIP